MLQTFTFSSEGRHINALGSFFKYEASTGLGNLAALRVRADGNDLGEFLPGDSIMLPQVATTWIVTPASAGVSGSVRIGVGQVQSNRFSGAVEVVNEQRNHALGGRAFCGESTDSTGASNYCTTQLYNPPGSAVKAVVSKIQIADANGSDWTGRRTLCVGFRNAMATSLYAASRPFRNKLLGGVAPQSQSRKGMTSSGSNWWMWQVPMYRNGVQTITFEEPVIVSAGQDFTVMDLTGTNGPIFTTIYDFIELPA